MLTRELFEEYLNDTLNAATSYEGENEELSVGAINAAVDYFSRLIPNEVINIKYIASLVSLDLKCKEAKKRKEAEERLKEHKHRMKTDPEYRRYREVYVDPIARNIEKMLWQGNLLSRLNKHT